MTVRFLHIVKRYLQEKDFILILALAHLHREPDYWVDRLSDENH